MDIRPVQPSALVRGRDPDPPRLAPEHGERNLKEDIVRALSVKWARPVAAPALIAEFPGARREGLKWAIGNALEVVADRSVLGDILALAGDKRHGKARRMIVMGLGRFRDPRVIAVLTKLLSDEDVTLQALSALRRLKVKEARPLVEPLLEHPSPQVRKSARAALDRWS